MTRFVAIACAILLTPGAWSAETPSLAELRAIPASSPLRPWALGEAAKILYRNEDWSAFFGLAYYIRLHGGQPKVRALEALALIRHCRWTEAYAVAQEPQIASEAAPIIAFLKMQPGLVEKPAPVPPPSFERRRHFWAVQGPRLEDPFRWRLLIDSQCPEKKP